MAKQSIFVILAGTCAICGCLGQAPETAHERGERHFASGEWTQAVAALTEAIELEPRDPRWHTLRGQAYFADGQLRPAIADYTAAIRLDPAYFEAYYNRALAYEAAGYADRAFADNRKARQLDPEHAKAYLFAEQAETAVADATRTAFDTEKSKSKQSSDGVPTRSTREAEEEQPAEHSPDLAELPGAPLSSGDGPSPFADEIAAQRANAFNSSPAGEPEADVGLPEFGSLRRPTNRSTAPRAFQRPIPVPLVRPTGRVPAAEAAGEL